MALTAGIVGLPNVGKSTLFNSLTKAEALAANYPFATIEPNVGMVEVPDDRLQVLAKMHNSKKIVPATCTFTDIAGLVKGASQGEGLGNQFLANIRNCDAILHVVRCFNNSDVTHVEGRVDPVGDAQIINLELILSDLEVVEKRIQKIEKKAKAKVEEAHIEIEVLNILKETLEAEKPIRSVEIEEEKQKFVHQLGFLTSKNVMYVANINEQFMSDPTTCENYNKLLEYALSENSKVVAFSAEIEAQLSLLEDEDKEMFFEDLGVTGSGMENLIKQTYVLLGLETYLTSGDTETRAWTFKSGYTAPQCAGVIHSDFERGFIKAETVAFNDLIAAGSMVKAKEAGKVRQEGKDYLVKDGDVILFKFNV